MFDAFVAAEEDPDNDPEKSQQTLPLLNEHSRDSIVEVVKHVATVFGVPKKSISARARIIKYRHAGAGTGAGILCLSQFRRQNQHFPLSFCDFISS